MIIFVALLRPLKGGALAIRAMRHLLRSRTDATLIVIGGGSDHERLKNLAEELEVSNRVRFLGKLPRPVVLGWMQISDVLLFPSLRDSGPLVILEAMSAGKPVVCLDLGGPEYFVTKECGFRVQPASPEEVILGLAAALDKLANDPALRQSMGAAGRRRVTEEFDWNTRGEQMQQIYRKLVKGP